MLTDVGRKLDKADSHACGLVANYLRKHGQLAYAREMYKKTGDFKSVVTLYVSFVIMIQENVGKLNNLSLFDLFIATSYFGLI